MHALSFSIHHLLPRSERRRQKRVALQLLTLSSVVRPGHVELRYPTTLISKTAFHAQQRITSQHPVIHPSPLQSWERTVTFHLKQIWRRVSSPGMTQHEGRTAGETSTGSGRFNQNGGGEMRPRYRTRIQAKFPVTITVGLHASEGRILDLTVPGCLIESAVSMKKGDYCS